jgi:hypothetical protein
MTARPTVAALAAEVAQLREQVAELRGMVRDVARLAEIVTGADRPARVRDILSDAGILQPPPPRHLRAVEGGKH